MRQTAPRAKLSLSKAYAIEKGDDNVEFDTFENIAAAFDMTPAELATAIGKGRPEDDPELVPIYADLRQIAPEKRQDVGRIVRTFVAAENSTGRANTDSTGRRRSRTGQSTRGDSELERRPPAWLTAIHGSVLSLIGFRNPIREPAFSQLSPA